jgi:hypothetical protein
MIDRTYRTPLSFRPPLALGGHGYLLMPQVGPSGPWARCVKCHRACPHWAIVEGLWCLFMPQICQGTIAALPPGPAPTDRVQELVDELDRSLDAARTAAYS